MYLSINIFDKSLEKKKKKYNIDCNRRFNQLKHRPYIRALIKR